MPTVRTLLGLRRAASAAGAPQPDDVRAEPGTSVAAEVPEPAPQGQGQDQDQDQDPAGSGGPVTEPDADAAVAPPERSGVHVGGGDLVALSHALAAAGRVHEAAIAQWAADLQLVRPLLGARAPELCAALESLSPLDPQTALTAARAALSSLVDADVPVLSLLGPTTHLSRGDGTVTRTRPAEPEPSDLPPAVELALEVTLQRSAARAGDRRQASVAVRRGLLRQRSAAPGAADPVELARGVLEKHEHEHFTAELAERTS